MSPSAPAPLPRIALFDLDHTLLPIDSDFTWSTFTNAQGWTDPAATQAENQYFYDQYKARTLNMDDYVGFVTRTLQDKTPQQQAAIQQQYARDYIAAHILPPARALLQQHRQQGDTLVLTTATNRFIAEPIGQLLGFERAHILCTELEYDAHGHITGRVRGTPNLGAGKVHNMQDWLQQHGWQWGDVHITFYSDSMNDLPLLERAQTPVATNPDPRLRELATQRGWQVLDLFEKRLV